MIIRAFRYLLGFDRESNHHPRVMLTGQQLVNQPMLERMINNGDLPYADQKVLAYHSNLMPRVALSSSRSTNPDVLELLSRDKSSLVRGNVATHPFTTERTVNRLAADQDELVCRMALDELKRRRAYKGKMAR